MNRSSDDFRPLHPGMGQAIAERTVLRTKPSGEWENWGDVAHRVALGNSSLTQEDGEYDLLRSHIAKGTVLLSGRHLQHGDETQASRNLEIFSNCATSASSFALFYLLLNGSGVGRCYDNDIMLTNWDNAPTLRCVMDHNHPDFDWSAHENVRDAEHKYGAGKDVLWFKVPDSREGWAKAVEIWENAAFQKIHKNKMLILDFSEVRPKGAPIGGMQGRPSSGPVPLMNALIKASSIKDGGMPPWLQTMYVDHYLAECVLVGGARRAARMSAKFWKDEGIFDFIEIKRPIEFKGMKADDVLEYRNQLLHQPLGFLWSSNNSVLVDKEFWNLLEVKRGDPKYTLDETRHARKVYQRIVECSYGDGTGEPGVINVDKLRRNDEDWNKLLKGHYFGSKKYQIEEESELYMSRLAKKIGRKKYNMIVNPCSEIALTMLGGFCVISDVVPYHADSLEDAEESIRVATRALMRVNTMDAIYDIEVKRTNRIGVGLTGVHEFAWKFFGYSFKDLINEEKSKDFWLTLARFNRAIRDEAEKYAKKLGMNVPHTMTTCKPSGTVSKMYSLSEGWHLPSMKRYLRWVQFREDDPLLDSYRKAGYPTKVLKSYQGTVIVGFPTEPTLSAIMPDELIVTAGEATPEEQYKWLMLGEKYWIIGTDEEGNQLEDTIGNQISFTLKYIPEEVSLKHFRDMFFEYQRKIKCCSVMPQSSVESSSYEYLPEEPVTKAKFEEIAVSIKNVLEEDIGKEHVDCSTGACPIDFSEDKKTASG